MKMMTRYPFNFELPSLAYLCATFALTKSAFCFVTISQSLSSNNRMKNGRMLMTKTKISHRKR